MQIQFTSEELAVEEWRPIPGYEGWYEASSLGRIRRIAPRKPASRPIGILSPARATGGYLRVTLCMGDRKDHLVHYLIAATFLGSRPDRKQINHKDGNKPNNRVANLEWVTAAENIQHSWALGLSHRQTAPRPNQTGEKHPRAKLTDRQVLDIRARYIPKVVTLKMLAAEYGVDLTCISLIIRHKNWRHI